MTQYEGSLLANLSLLKSASETTLILSEISPVCREELFRISERLGAIYVNVKHVLKQQEKVAGNGHSTINPLM